MIVGLSNSKMHCEYFCHNTSKGVDKLGFSFVTLLIAFMIISLNISPVFSQTTKMYENIALGARILYPSDWNVEYEGLSVTFRSLDGNSAIQLFGILDSDGDLDLEEAANVQLNTIKLYGLNFQILNRGPTSINGDDFYSLLLKVQFNNGIVAKDLYLFTKAADTPYIFKLESLDDQDNRKLSDQLYSEGLSILQQMIISAELTGLDLDSLEQGLDGGGGGDFNPFEPDPNGQGGGFGGQNPGGGGDRKSVV